MSKATITLVICATCISLSSGCAAWTDKSKSKDSKWSSMQFWKKPFQKPNKVAAIWTHDILAMTGKPPTRGFGGRLYFYNDKSQTIPVDGELIVHGYEEVRFGLTLQTEKTQADKTFVFTAEQFTEHFGSSDLGASYSIWIPWDAADGVQKEITLIPTFKGKDGTILQGEPAKLVLPGRKLEDPLATAAIQHVSIQQSQTPTNMGPLQQMSGLRTTTISVPNQTNLTSNNTGRNKSSSVVVHDSNNGTQNSGMNGNLMYAGTPQAARANAMFAAYANQANANQNTQYPGTQYQSSTYQSSMPNALPSQLPQNQYSLQNQQSLQNPGMQNPGMQNPGMQNQGLQSQGLQNPQQPNFQMPNSLTPSAPNQLPPSRPGSQPGLQPATSNVPNPGFATYAPLQAGAIEAAFASTPQFQPLGQPRTGLNQVQPASFNTPQSGVNSGQVMGQSPVQPGQPIFQR